jgi:plastocyanin
MRQTTSDGMMGKWSRAMSGMQQIAICDFAFQPADLTISAGTTLTWTNHDGAPHTVTFRNGMADSGTLSSGRSFSYTFATPGGFAYYCRIHPNMAAEVTVTA